jgi:transcriptional regulator of arginine metabolism
MQKTERHELILKLITREAISRQDVLANKLSKAGFAVTQASISRDLDELGVRKVDGLYARVRPSGAGLDLRSITAVGDNLLVIKCDPGLASAVTVRIDRAAFDEVIGTIAGDDTIFVAVADRVSRDAAQEKISTLFG